MQPHEMKIVMMGTPDFAIPSVKMLIREGYAVVGVVCQPNKPKGRGEKMSCPPVATLALREGLDLIQPSSVKTQSYLQWLQEKAPMVVVTAAYGKILPPNVLQVPTFGTVNVHASVLPALRGAAPIHHAIIEGHEKTGITTMLTDEGMDTGDILKIKTIDIGQKDTVGQLHDKLAELGACVLSKTLQEIRNGTVTRTPQDHDKATYAPFINKETGRIDFDQPAKRIHDRIRGVTPWPGAFCYYEDKRLKLYDSWYTDHMVEQPPGTIISIDKESMEIAAKLGTVVIRSIQFESCKRMPIGLCGHNMQQGVQLCPTRT